MKTTFFSLLLGLLSQPLWADGTYHLKADLDPELKVSGDRFQTTLRLGQACLYHENLRVVSRDQNLWVLHFEGIQTENCSMDDLNKYVYGLYKNEYEALFWWRNPYTLADIQMKDDGVRVQRRHVVLEYQK